MNPSEPDHFAELSTAFIEGDLDATSAARLEELLRENPERTQAFRENLDFADRLEQSLMPNRSVPAFLNGLETRFHAEATADEFLEDLLPRLREVDQRQASKIIRFPVRWALGLSAAAAVAVAALVVFRAGPGGSPGASGVARLAQTSTDIVWSKPAGQPAGIEWEVGSSIPAGTSIRLESGIARFDLANGSVITLEGPADIQLESTSEARLVRGNVLASVAPDDEPFTIRASGMEYQVEGSTTGVRTLEGDKLEASVLSVSGSATAVSQVGNGSKDEIGPNEALVTHSQDGLKELVPIDPNTYRGHLNLLAGITRHSDDVTVEVADATEPARQAPVMVALEKENIESKTPVRVDITPGTPLPLGQARNLALSNHPEMAPGKRLRSYVVEVGSVTSTPAGSGYVDSFIEFDKPIAGIAATPETLGASNAVAGGNLAKGTTPGLPESDNLEISKDGRTLRLRIKEGERLALSSFRVFVHEPEIISPGHREGVWAAPRVNSEEKPDLTGKNPDVKP